MKKPNKINNEVVGISAELAIAEFCGVSIPKKYKNRGCEDVKNMIIYSLQNSDDIKYFTEVEFIGNKSGERKKQSKSSVDFIAKINNKEVSISVKSNISKSVKVCPPELGQPCIETFNQLFMIPRSMKPIKNKQEFKKIVYEQIDVLLDEYLSKLFSSDYIFHFQKNNEYFQFTIIESKILKSFKFDKKFISFTKETIEEWNESNTVKYNCVSIGEFQVHNNRSSLKFRFNFVKLLDLIKSYNL